MKVTLVLDIMILSSTYSFTLKMEATDSSETLVTLYQIHGLISEKIVIFIGIAMRILNLR
jgi:hypothetical protein